eukprot:m.23268 g.23268  ORF g.23268 m.23268 type:complete len:491 (-) comp5922_c0_seq2:55-1527(-)
MAGKAGGGGGGSGKGARGGGIHKGFPISFADIQGVPSAPNLDWALKRSPAEANKAPVDRLMGLQLELDSMQKLSRARSEHVAQQLVLLQKWHEETWTGDRGAKRRTTSGPEGAAPTSRRKVSGDGGNGGITPRKSDPYFALGEMIGVTGPTGSSVTGSPPKNKGRGQGKKRERKQSVDVRTRPSQELLPDAEVMPKLPDEHPFWADIALYFKDLTSEDMHRLNECVSEVTGVDPELAVIPPKGRSFQASFADQAHVAEARAQAQSLDQVPASMDFDDPSTHEALGEGDVTRRLLAMLVEDDPESRELCGITLDRRGPRHAGPHKHPGTVAEARSIDRGVSRVLQELGLVEPATVAKAEDEVYQELARLQQELRIKTAECRSRMHDLMEDVARTVGANAKYQMAKSRERELAELDNKIEKAYFQRQAALRNERPPPIPVSDPAVAALLEAREAVLKGRLPAEGGRVGKGRAQGGRASKAPAQVASNAHIPR